MSASTIPTSVARATSLVVALGALGGVVALSVRKLADFDLPGHLAVGRLVVLHRGPLLVDELSAAARPVRYVEYVSDVTLYLLARAGGPLALQILGGVLALAVAALLVRGGKRGGAFVYAIVALALAAMQPWLLVRPATMSFVLLAALIVALEETRDGMTSRRLFWLIPMFALWANVHGFVVVGLVLLVGYALYSALCRAARGRMGPVAPEAHGRPAGYLALVAVGSLAASLCNQAGWLLLTGPFRAIHDAGHIAEWAPTTLPFLLHEAPLAGLFGVVAVFALVAGKEPSPTGTPRRGVTLFDVGLMALALVLARSAVRMLPVAMILVAPMTARRLGTLLPRRAWLDVSCALVTWLAGAWMVAASPASRGVGFDPAHFSESAIGYIERLGPVGPMYNTLPLGGWLDWRLFPRYRTFVDHRQAWVHDADVLATYYASETDPQAFAELSARFDFQWAVVFAAEGSRFALPIVRSASWTMVYWDDVTAIYVRNDGPNADIARQGYRALRHLTSPEQMLGASVARDGRAKSLADDGRLAEAQAPDSPRAAFFAGCGAIATRDRVALDAAIAKLVDVAPGHPGIDVLRQGWDVAEERAR